MYAYIQGLVTETYADKVVIEANGIGYEIWASSITQKKLLLGTAAKLYTYLHLAENVMALYGFADKEERDMFKKLLSVSRVGPKLSLSVLSVLTPADVRAAVLTNTPSAFDRVQGMGRKTAQRVILELQEITKGETAPLGAAGDAPVEDIRSEAVAALTSLGYDGLASSRVVASISDAKTVEELLTKALRKLAK